MLFPHFEVLNSLQRQSVRPWKIYGFEKQFVQLPAKLCHFRYVGLFQGWGGWFKIRVHRYKKEPSPWGIHLRNSHTYMLPFNASYHFPGHWECSTFSAFKCTRKESQLSKRILLPPLNVTEHRQLCLCKAVPQFPRLQQCTFRCEDVKVFWVISTPEISYKMSTQFQMHKDRPYFFHNVMRPWSL